MSYKGAFVEMDERTLCLHGRVSVFVDEVDIVMQSGEFDTQQLS